MSWFPAKSSADVDETNRIYTILNFYTYMTGEVVQANKGFQSLYLFTTIHHEGFGTTNVVVTNHVHV